VVWLDCGRDRARVRSSQGGLLYSAKRSDAKGALASVSSHNFLNQLGVTDRRLDRAMPKISLQCGEFLLAVNVHLSPV